MADSSKTRCGVDDVFAQLNGLVSDRSELETIRVLTRLILLMANEIDDFTKVCVLIEHARSKGG